VNDDLDPKSIGHLEGFKWIDQCVVLDEVGGHRFELLVTRRRQFPAHSMSP
jgi:hypothetical protein